MANNKSTNKTSMKDQIAARRQQNRQRQMVLNLAIITGAALVILALIILYNRQMAASVVLPETKTRPTVEGKVMGDPNAPVTIEVFEDFQCPACKNFTDTVEPQLIETYIKTGKAKLVFRHFAFIGLESTQAANASMCASEQNRFWDYHDVIFANQIGENIGSFSDRRLGLFAEQLGLDMDAFNTCMQNNTYASLINDEKVLGQQYGVNATPSIVVNGRLLAANNLGVISSAVEQALLNQP